LCDKDGEGEIRDDLDGFFSSLSLVIKANDGGGKKYKPDLILVDKFTKLIPELEYGYVDKYFPDTSVAPARNQSWSGMTQNGLGLSDRSESHSNISI
jgi:hypothetical protein